MYAIVIWLLKNASVSRQENEGRFNVPVARSHSYVLRRPPALAVGRRYQDVAPTGLRRFVILAANRSVSLRQRANYTAITFNTWLSAQRLPMKTFSDPSVPSRLRG